MASIAMAIAIIGSWALEQFQVHPRSSSNFRLGASPEASCTP
jgi:hypothetical protein